MIQLQNFTSNKLVETSTVCLCSCPEFVLLIPSRHTNSTTPETKSLQCECDLGHQSLTKDNASCNLPHSVLQQVRTCRKRNVDIYCTSQLMDTPISLHIDCHLSQNAIMVRHWCCLIVFKLHPRRRFTSVVTSLQWIPYTLHSDNLRGSRIAFYILS